MRFCRLPCKQKCRKPLHDSEWVYRRPSRSVELQYSSGCGLTRGSAHLLIHFSPLVLPQAQQSHMNPSAHIHTPITHTAHLHCKNVPAMTRAGQHVYLIPPGPECFCPICSCGTLNYRKYALCFSSSKDCHCLHHNADIGTISVHILWGSLVVWAPYSSTLDTPAQSLRGKVCQLKVEVICIGVKC